MTFIRFHNYWKMIPIPIISAWKQPHQQLIQIVLSKRPSLINWSTKLGLIPILLLIFIHVLVFTIWHVEYFMN